MRLSEIIQRHGQEILSAWTEEARRAAAARGLEGPEFTNLVPRYLSALERADDLGQPSPERRELVEGHLSTRLRQGFQVSEIVDEFSLLGRCITSFCRKLPPEQQPDALEIEQLLTELHLASVVITDMFANHMLEDEQIEKRYQRLLQSTALEALRGEGPTGEMLERVLGLVMEAMGAQSAAVLVYDAEAKRLTTVASVGAADEELELFACSIVPTSFPGLVAGSEKATAILDVATTELRVSEALRTSGIHSVLGVRLMADGELRGVMHVGLAETRPFSAREVRRLESLGYQLFLHLETARVQGELRERIEALGVEREVRERIVSLIAHDLRGPLSTAKIGVTMMQSSPELPRGLRGVASKVGRNLDRIDHMIRDLLDASRVRAGERLAIQVEQGDAVALARELLDDLAQVHGDRFVLVGDQSAPGYFGAEELVRALWNLGTNAAKYGAAGRPITISVRTVGETIELSVHNEGAVIPEEDRGLLFEPFRRSRAAQGAGQGGWGLGLALVRGCAEAHGGTVSVRSLPLEGTTFTMTIPRDARPSQSAAAPSPPSPRPSGSPAERRRGARPTHPL